MISGRSFNDIDNYPIFPWVETYFKSHSIRNLSFPITMESTKNRNINQQQDISKLKQSPNNRRFVCSVFSCLELFSSLNNRYNFETFSSIHSVFERIRDFNENRESFSEFYSLPEIFIFGDQTLLTPKIEIISATPIKTSFSEEKSHDDISEESSFSITIADDDLSDEKIECISSPHVFLRASESWTKVTMNDLDDKDSISIKHSKVFSFVYESRKLLNSLSMSPSLCRWIDFVFGVDQTDKLYESYLFSHQRL